MSDSTNESISDSVNNGDLETIRSTQHSRARQRMEARRKRRQVRDSMARRVQQVQDTTATPRVQIPPILQNLARIRIPGGRWLLLIPLSVVLLIGAVIAIGSLNPRERIDTVNGVWLNRDWTYNTRTDADLIQLAGNLRSHEARMIYAYISSLKEDYTWSGDPQRLNRYSEVESDVRLFVQRLRQVHEQGNIYAWIEIRANTPAGYRLDDPLLHNTVAEFSRNAIEGLGYDGVFLDVKPVFDGNEDYLTLLRVVRAALGVNTPIAVSVPPDFTPTDADLTVPAQIAPDTLWSDEYKQRVALQADQIIITAYNSYRSDPEDYANWVAYQINSYAAALSQLDTGSQVFLSLPDYSDAPPAHLAVVENVDTALNGVLRAREALGDDVLLDGLTIFSDGDISEETWRTFRERWIQ